MRKIPTIHQMILLQTV